MAQVTIDWNSIRPLNGGREKGFEELCAQLAHAESPSGSRFVRKGTPDAGVECYAVLGDGSEWGWQAKYFDALGDSQWTQLDSSVKSAIEKHRRLVRYFICLPIDRPDARIENKKSAQDRWDEHVSKWTRWASTHGMSVEFVYWGSHELLERLARPENVGRVRFWFDVRGFDGAWFSARLDEALRTAGPRYTPEIHVDLPIASEFEAFGRTDQFFDRIKARAKTIRKRLRDVKYSGAKVLDPVLDGAVAALSSRGQAILDQFAAIEIRPIGSLPFSAIAEQINAAETVAEDLSRTLAERERQEDAKPQTTTDASAASRYHSNPFRNRRFEVHRLTSELQEAAEELEHAQAIAGNPLMLLRGVAGTGKTHLLCDVARQRLAAGRPTVLLMGQRFVSNDDPWIQALQQLDMPGISADEFVGALEAAAQAAGSRALLMIDAINEGAGRIIWPSHLAAFVAHLERSPWIGVVLSVRSSYEELVLPADMRASVVAVTHQGFTDREYDATRTFFVHYGLELPSTPLLSPEFRNPLFLKTLCRGLNATGQRRLPRGFHGITAVFDLYLSAVNERLASTLGVDPRRSFTRNALEAFSTALLESGERWLPLSKAEDVVNALLPGREFERSLYRGLVVEGLLVEEAGLQLGRESEEVVFVAYERFADHLAAKTLLDRHLADADPHAAFAPGKPLAFVNDCDERNYIAPGLLEALCTQIPERVGKELIDLAPNSIDRWGMGDAFRQSLVWRAYAGFSDSTRDALNKLTRSKHDLHDTVDVLLTVATLPGHPLNAIFLDQRLRRDSMPSRDAWWSVYLHQAWGSHGAVDRLVDWSSSLTPTTFIDDESVDLCAIALSWMLTTSNRFLRDRATKALVSLLTGRLEAVTRLVKRFADVNDPYVTERVYAVAYGVAMRCHDPIELGALAAYVYTRIFAAGSPPPHILLRDYARGVVERALYLGSGIEVIAERIRPPYNSQWPTIPTEEAIAPLLPDWSRGSHDSGEVEWARNHIGFSVMGDDFARYVIGTNSSKTSNHWLSLRLDEPIWKPPARWEDRLRSQLAELSDDERAAWDQFEAADEAHTEASRVFVADWLTQREKEGHADDLNRSDLSALALEIEKARPASIAVLDEQRKNALAAAEAVLTKEHAAGLAEILSSKEDHRHVGRPPGFELSQIQRYILWRVFDLGWTTERFGEFDRFYTRNDGREASKAERIGKKYQWIAYHEIMALVADRFQYREQFRDNDGDTAYQGPWQDYLHDIDPSCTLRATRGGTSWDGHSAAWWGSALYNDWGKPDAPRQWALNRDDLPNMAKMLQVTNPVDGARWLNGQGYFNWKQQPPADRESTDVERRELWYICTAYLIRTSDAESFLEWAKGVDFWGRWMPDAPEVYKMFLGEYAWAPASRYFQQQYYGDDGWTNPGRGCPASIRTVAFEYRCEAKGFDCSIDEGYTLRLPVSELVTGLGIRWSGAAADFLDSSGRLAVEDPTAKSDGPSALLLREDILRDYLARENLTICWTVLGEKRVLSAGFGDGPYHPSLRISGAYILAEDGPVGFVNYVIDDPSAATGVEAPNGDEVP